MKNFDLNCRATPPSLRVDSAEEHFAYSDNVLYMWSQKATFSCIFNF